jgi:hypothetical protein
MSDEEFWNLIDRSVAESAGDRTKQVEVLVSAVAKLSEQEIYEYFDWFAEKQDLCYSEEFLDVASKLIGSVSDDGFQDFQCWLISQGKQFFEEALNSPASLLKLKKRTEGKLDISFEFEEFYYVPMHAFEKSTGKDWYESADL